MLSSYSALSCFWFYWVLSVKHRTILGGPNALLHPPSPGSLTISMNTNWGLSNTNSSSWSPILMGNSKCMNPPWHTLKPRPEAAYSMILKCFWRASTSFTTSKTRLHSVTVLSDLLECSTSKWICSFCASETRFYGMCVISNAIQLTLWE